MFVHGNTCYWGIYIGSCIARRYVCLLQYMQLGYRHRLVHSKEVSVFYAITSYGDVYTVLVFITGVVVPRALLGPQFLKQKTRSIYV